MLDHDDGVAEIAQVPERFQQTVVIALVQADGRLVEHVHHHQPGADLRRARPDALRLATGQGFALRSSEDSNRPDVVEKPDPVADFPDDALGDLPLAAVRC